MSAERLTILWEKYLSDQMTPAERSEFQELGADPRYQEHLDTLMQSLFEENRYPVKPETDREKNFGEVMRMAASRTAPSATIRPVHFLRKWRWVAAASIMLLLGAGAYFWPSGKKIAGPAVMVNADIQPGKDGAVLTLADGRQVSLDTIKTGVVALQGGTTARIANGTLVYEGTGNEVMYNTMSTPKGRQFHLTLPDGTRIWLNAASSIRYPTVFTGTERRVEITGEAYFEVARDKKMPFRLNINNRVGIKVLGTHFNVSAYENEEMINTTLIEGSVHVSDVADQPEGRNTQPGITFSDRRGVTLKPGQQAQIANVPVDRKAQTESGSGIKVINNADIEKATAWKNGLFYFDGATLREIMRQVERWYDIEVVFEKGVRNAEFAGKMTRGITLQGLLIVLEKSDVHYRLDGKKLTILP